MNHRSKLVMEFAHMSVPQESSCLLVMVVDGIVLRNFTSGCELRDMTGRHRGFASDGMALTERVRK